VSTGAECRRTEARGRASARRQKGRLSIRRRASGLLPYGDLRLLACSLALLLAAGCATVESSRIVMDAAPGAAGGGVRAAAIVDALQRLLDGEVAAHPSLPGQLLHVHAPAAGVDASLAAGVFDRASGRPLEPGDGFRVASVTKTFTAVAVLRLVEEERLGLDDAVETHLPAEYAALLREGGYATDRITVRHLLTHTSGIHDYATDPRYPAAVFGDPGRRWTRVEQVWAAVEWGSPRFAPGEGYHYSDTGYLLLGEILEGLTGGGLAEALRSLVGYARLGLETTYLESLEAPPPGAGALSHPYFGDADIAGLDPSADLYGGGGLVSTTRDLARFYRALLRGEVFRHPRTLETMLAVPPANREAPGGPYAMGIQARTIGGERCWGHTGFWGTAAHHCPASDVTLVRHTNQALPAPEWVFASLYGHAAALLGMEEGGGR
jgi:D-alanyl-D-alanine carboxypeptidase